MGRVCAPSGDDIISGNVALTTAAFLGMGLLCSVEMLFLILYTFRRRSGLYFWSLVLANISEISVNISSILYYWVLRDSCPGIVAIFSIPGAFFYVVFEFLILYSRLQLVQVSKRTSRTLLAIICAEAALVELPVAIISLGAAVKPLSNFASWYHIMWQTEAVIYAVVDIILSATYVVQIKRFWGKDSSVDVRSILRDVIVMTLFVVGFDVVNAVLVFINPLFPIMYGLEVRATLQIFLLKSSADFTITRGSCSHLS
jgi:hypothetical protein